MEDRSTFTKLSLFFKKWQIRASKLYEYLPYFWNKTVRGISIDSPPVFIVGCGHSGTTILLAILSAHSRLFAVPNETSVAMTEDEARAERDFRRFDRLAIGAGKHRWVEKTPKHILRIGKILEWRPEARVILIIRDGRDVAYSIQKRTANLELGVNRWIDDNRAGQQYWDHANVHVMRYEELVTDFATTIGAVMAFLGEQYEPAMATQHTQPKKWYSKQIAKPESVRTGENNLQLRNWQINQPLFDGRGGWKKLSAEELAKVEAIAGPMLAEYGYTNK